MQLYLDGDADAFDTLFDRHRAPVCNFACVMLGDAALAAGMKPVLMDGLEKAARGITSLQEVCRVVPE